MDCSAFYLISMHFCVVHWILACTHFLNDLLMLGVLSLVLICDSGMVEIGRWHEHAWPLLYISVLEI